MGLGTRLDRIRILARFQSILFPVCGATSNQSTHYKIAASRQILAVGPGHSFTHPHHHVWWMHYCNTVQEHSPVVCLTESSGEQRLRLSRVERLMVVGGGE